MNPVARHARFYAAQVGLAGVTGVALLVFAVAFAVSAVRPLQQEVKLLKARADRLQTAAASTRERSADARSGNAAALEAFPRRFPRFEEASQLVLMLHESAKRNGIVLDTGEYTVTPDAEARLVRYQVRFPVKGGYVPLRRFVADAMTQVPTMMLDEVTVRRASIAAGEVEARLQFTMLFADGS
ncbi:MAG TPA: hypothetical protein VKF40_11575 [Burkholderiales bacterium]|nr:hypothetical protein [Burkholderiales bacterium]